MEPWFVNFAFFLSSVEMKLVKGSGGKHRLCFCFEPDKYHIPYGVSFVKTVQGKNNLIFDK